MLWASILIFILGVCALAWDFKANDREPSSVEAFFSRTALVLCIIAFIVFTTCALVALIP